MGVTLIRHTRLKASDGICYGRTDLDVADTFDEDALAALAAAPAVEVIVSSPLRRCRKLASYIAAARDLAVESDPRLQEMDFGAWEGRRWSDIPKVELDAWADDFLNARPHGGESVSMLRARTNDALAEFCARKRPVLAVTHAGVIKAALSNGDSADSFSTHVDFGAAIRMPEIIIRSA